MSNSRWIGDERYADQYSVGEIGFLVETSHHTKGWVNFELRSHPPKTNQSFEQTCDGWCGSYNDVSTYGRGLWEVVRVARNGRAYIKRLEGEALKAALDELGYPELFSDCGGEA